MASYGAPRCYECEYLDVSTLPRKIGQKAQCTKYEKIPDEIFFRAGKCDKYLFKQK